MESVYVGWLSVLPAVIAIGLALLTKNAIFSMLVASAPGL